MKITAVIPFYKTYEETIKLFDVLIPQLTNEIEVIVIDDGCHEERLDKYKDKINIIHLEENHGLSYARNRGIEQAKGDYIVFIDSDDSVANDYFATIINKINTCDFDYCYFGWKPMHCNWSVKIFDKPPAWNWSVWNAVYKREYVELFDENIRVYEDVPWQKVMRAKNGKKANIEKILYYYNNGRPGSLTATGGNN